VRELLLLAVHLQVAVAKLVRPDGVPAVAQSLVLKPRLLIRNRSRQRAPNVTVFDRFVLGLKMLFASLHRVAKLGAHI